MFSSLLTRLLRTLIISRSVPRVAFHEGKRDGDIPQSFYSAPARVDDRGLADDALTVGWSPFNAGSPDGNCDVSLVSTSGRDVLWRQDQRESHGSQCGSSYSLSQSPTAKTAQRRCTSSYSTLTASPTVVVACRQCAPLRANRRFQRPASLSHPSPLNARRRPHRPLRPTLQRSHPSAAHRNGGVLIL
ncbi:hypothetical protein BD626DRAFT_513731 [Schizophyllum amplum]|uniref:Uncharacterized protein n=1 Tax=Schizophyllum amplum TaxID=97359 RepID=A0A550BZ70_9AGAR|nr:hypothetical protein BD626DRAFT_513731 [Auriculariopsis ampla]